MSCYNNNEKKKNLVALFLSSSHLSPTHKHTRKHTFFFFFFFLRLLPCFAICHNHLGDLEAASEVVFRQKHDFRYSALSWADERVSVFDNGVLLSCLSSLSCPVLSKYSPSSFHKKSINGGRHRLCSVALKPATAVALQCKYTQLVI